MTDRREERRWETGELKDRQQQRRGQAARSLTPTDALTPFNTDAMQVRTCESPIVEGLYVGDLVYCFTSQFVIFRKPE